MSQVPVAPAGGLMTADLGALITGTAVTATQTSADLANGAYRGIKVVFDVTTNASGSVTCSIQGKDKASGKYVTLLAGAAVASSTGTTVYTVYPGLPATANVSANDVLTQTFRVVVTANNANAATYTVGVHLLP